MANLIEVRWHGRGGQGAKTAALLLAEAAIAEGKYGQAFPEYGPERTGAPVRGFTRISDEPIRIHSAIQNPDVVIVLDQTLLDTIDVTEGTKPNSILIFNTTMTKEEIKKELSSFTNKWLELPCRWTKKENLHITLMFLGYLSNDELLEVLKITREVASRNQPFSINLIKIVGGSFLSSVNLGRNFPI
ncbi:MAG: 2-oxoacid:acceptor oxidoreductase family protein [candidate division KSB1 bacterium]|nr:2-oxoacid:acceptor oxidoreductase family protein [candidate division KSB1 bacterium]